MTAQHLTMNQAGLDGPDPGTGVTSREPVQLLRAGRSTVGDGQDRGGPRKPRSPAHPGPLSSAHAQRAGGARIFSREWRAHGDDAPLPAPRKAPIGALAMPTHRVVKAHVPLWVHFSRKGHVFSSLECACGQRIRVCDRDRVRCHAALADAFSVHKLGHPRHWGHPKAPMA